MKKLLHERVREYDTSQGGSCSLFMRLLGLSCDDYDHCEDCVNVMMNTLADEIERYYIPRPRYKDGVPAHSKDFGNLSTIQVYGDGSWRLIVDDETGYKNNQEGSVYDYVKRPQPKVLDADGIEINVGDKVYSLNDEKERRYEVTGFGIYGVYVSDGSFGKILCDAKSLTHKEPDSFEKLRDEISAQYAQGHQIPRSVWGSWADRLSALIERGA